MSGRPGVDAALREFASRIKADISDPEILAAVTALSNAMSIQMRLPDTAKVVDKRVATLHAILARKGLSVERSTIEMVVGIIMRALMAAIAI